MRELQNSTHQGQNQALVAQAQTVGSCLSWPVLDPCFHYVFNGEQYGLILTVSPFLAAFVGGPALVISNLPSSGNLPPKTGDIW